MGALWIYCIVDVAATEDQLVRALPKRAWFMLVMAVPTLGAIGWMAIGRPRYTGWRPGGKGGERDPRPPRRRYRGPEDDPGFIPPND